jgi:thioester reductase-like protein
MKLRPRWGRIDRRFDRVVEPAADVHAYSQLRRAESARIREIGDMVALGRPDEARKAFAAAIAISQELHTPGSEAG